MVGPNGLIPSNASFAVDYLPRLCSSVKSQHFVQLILSKSRFLMGNKQSIRIDSATTAYSKLQGWVLTRLSSPITAIVLLGRAGVVSHIRWTHRRLQLECKCNEYLLTWLGFDALQMHINIDIKIINRIFPNFSDFFFSFFLRHLFLCFSYLFTV